MALFHSVAEPCVGQAGLRGTRHHGRFATRLPLFVLQVGFIALSMAGCEQAGTSDSDTGAGSEGAGEAVLAPHEWNTDVLLGEEQDLAPRKELQLGPEDVEKLRKRADDGNAEAMWNLVVYYDRKGESVKAREWEFRYIMAAPDKDAVAIVAFEVGMTYLFGGEQGTEPAKPQNKQRGIEALVRSGTAGFSGAYILLRDLAEEGVVSAPKEQVEAWQQVARDATKLDQLTLRSLIRSYYRPDLRDVHSLRKHIDPSTLRQDVLDEAPIPSR